MDYRIPMVRILSDDVVGGVLINESDYDPKIHVIIPEKKVEAVVENPEEDWTKDEIITNALSHYGLRLNPASRKADLLKSYYERKAQGE